MGFAVFLEPQEELSLAIQAWKKMIELKKYFEKIEKPIFPVKAKLIMQKYNVKEGKELGQKLKHLENLWIENSFKITDKEINKVFLS